MVVVGAVTDTFNRIPPRVLEALVAFGYSGEMEYYGGDPQLWKSPDGAVRLRYGGPGGRKPYDWWVISDRKSFGVRFLDSEGQFTVRTEDYKAREGEKPLTEVDVSKLVAEGHGDLRVELARSPLISNEHREILSRDKDWAVRKGIAMSDLTAPEVLESLAADEDSGVRGEVAENVRTPREALVLLAGDSNYWVRRAVIENPMTPLTVVKGMDIEKKETVLLTKRAYRLSGRGYYMPSQEARERFGISGVVQASNETGHPRWRVGSNTYEYNGDAWLRNDTKIRGAEAPVALPEPDEEDAKALGGLGVPVVTDGGYFWPGVEGRELRWSSEKGWEFVGANDQVADRLTELEEENRRLREELEEARAKPPAPEVPAEILAVVGELGKRKNGWWPLSEKGWYLAPLSPLDGGGWWLAYVEGNRTTFHRWEGDQFEGEHPWAPSGVKPGTFYLLPRTLQESFQTVTAAQSSGGRLRWYTPRGLISYQDGWCFRGERKDWEGEPVAVESVPEDILKVVGDVGRPEGDLEYVQWPLPREGWHVRYSLDGWELAFREDGELTYWCWDEAAKIFPGEHPWACGEKTLEPEEAHAEIKPATYYLMPEKARHQYKVACATWRVRADRLEWHDQERGLWYYKEGKWYLNGVEVEIGGVPEEVEPVPEEILDYIGDEVGAPHASERWSGVMWPLKDGWSLRQEGRFWQLAYVEGNTLSYQIWDEETKTFPGVHPWEPPKSLTVAVQHEMDEHMLREADRARDEKVINDLVDEVLADEETAAKPLYLMPIEVQEKFGIEGGLPAAAFNDKYEIHWKVGDIRYFYREDPNEVGVYPFRNGWFRKESEVLPTAKLRGLNPSPIKVPDGSDEEPTPVDTIPDTYLIPSEIYAGLNQTAPVFEGLVYDGCHAWHCDSTTLTYGGGLTDQGPNWTLVARGITYAWNGSEFAILDADFLAPDLAVPEPIPLFIPDAIKAALGSQSPAIHDGHAYHVFENGRSLTIDPGKVILEDNNDSYTWNGSKFDLDYSPPALCTSCHGFGVRDGSPCQDCDGDGDGKSYRELYEELQAAAEKPEAEEEDLWEVPTEPSYLMPYWVQERLGLAGRSELLEPRRPDENGHLLWEVGGLSYWCDQQNWWYRGNPTRSYSSTYRGAPFEVPTLPDDLIAYMGGSWEVLPLTEGNVFQLSHSGAYWTAVHENGEWTLRGGDPAAPWNWENGKLMEAHPTVDKDPSVGSVVLGAVGTHLLKAVGGRVAGALTETGRDLEVTGAVEKTLETLGVRAP